MTDVHGSCDAGFETVREALGVLLDTGADVGASAAVVHDGRVVADLWGGYTDAERTAPWERDTIACLWSTTKTMCNLSALLLVDRGALDLDTPVAAYWPEFATAGKDGVLVRHLLGHTAGLPSWRTRIPTETLYDWDLAASLLAADEPWWEPGTAAGYHAATQGFLVGEVVRRITGQTLGSFFASELADPLGADLHIGTPESCDSRIAPMIPPPAEGSAGLSTLSDLAVRAMVNPPLPAGEANTVAWRRAEIPAGNGFGNARSVATVQSVVSCGGEVRGRRFLSGDTLARIFEIQADGPDLIIGTPVRYGIGYGLASPDHPYPSQRTCYWGGRGGSLVVNDLDNRLTIAYVMNRMHPGGAPDTRAASIVGAAFAGLASLD